MDFSTKRKPLVHVLHHRKQNAPRKRANSLGYEEKPGPDMMEDEQEHKFKFPAPPQKPKYCLSKNMSYLSTSDSDSQSDSGQYGSKGISSPSCVHSGLKCQGYQSEGSPIPLHSVPRLLPPIGVFWDIENCQVPKGRSAVAVAEVIRKKFFTGYREVEFLVVCDVKKESNQILQELNDAQINLIHVASMCKNAADEKLRQSMRRFADIHGSPASIILISGDINFAADITDLRYRKKINVILLHMENASENLILCASEHYSFTELVESLPPRGSIKQSNQPVEVVVYNLPADKDSNSVKMRLRQLSDNCGGRVTTLKHTCATIRFASFDIASRAQKRMDGEDVFGNKILVSQPVKLAEKDGSPQKYSNFLFAGKKYQGNILKESWSEMPLRGPPGFYQCMPPFNLLSSSMNHHPYVGNWAMYGTSAASVSAASEYYGGLCSGFHTPPVDMMTNRNNSSFAAFSVQNQSLVSSRLPCEEIINSSCDVVERAPKGFRKIKGVHKGVIPKDTSETEVDVRHIPVDPFLGAQNSKRALRKAALCDLHAPGVNVNGISAVSSGIATDAANGGKRIPVKGRDYSRSRTPTPVPQQYDGDLDEPEHFFHPISSTNNSLGNESGPADSVELHVSNLDQTFGAREMKKILLNAFKDHVMVLSLLVLTQPDGSLNALVRLASQQDAQYAIYKLQRRKIGRKRISISHATASGPSPQLIRSQVISLLQDVPNHRLPLFKFCELYESRFLSSISISDICKVKECHVTDGPRGRIVSLLVDSRNSPSPQLSILPESEVLEQQFCPIHGTDFLPNRGWAEQEVMSLPIINMSLKLLAIRIHALLQSHNGNLHLASLPQCYQAQFEPLREDKNGVFLEHLVSCLPGIEIYVSSANIKYLRWSKTQSVSSNSSKTEEEPTKNLTTPLAGQLAVFSRELVDLLKTSPTCQLLFEKFIPAYHHHFGRQCRVADYGFTKLIELLESLPHTVQVLGEGNRRVITLSHRIQLKRFMGDLLRILRMQANKQVLLSELPDAFERVFSKPLNVCSYGVCDVRDLITDLSDTSVMVTPVDNSDDDLLIAIPKREQTPEEIEKTKQFAVEVVDLLRHVPNFSMRFNKFIPAHHIHFGWQCRVADYGFTKLIDLFEAIPDIVQVITLNGERWVCLTLKERLNVLSDQIVPLLHSALECTMSVCDLNNTYCSLYGYSLRPESFECSSIEELLGKLSSVIEVLASSDGPLVTLKSNLKMKNVHRILTEEPNCSMEFKDLASKCRESCNQSLSLNDVKYMKDVEVIESDGKSIVRLGWAVVQQQFMQDLHKLVVEAGGRLPLSSLKSKFLLRYGRTCQPSQFGFSSLGAMLQTLRGTVLLRGRGTRRFVVLADSTTSAKAGSILGSSEAVPDGNEKGETAADALLFDKADVLSNNGDSGNDEGSSSAVDGDVSLSSGSKIHTSQRSSASEVLSDGSTSMNGSDPTESQKQVSPKNANGLGFNPDVSPVWCAESPPSFTPYKGPWSTYMYRNVKVTDTPAVMLSPSSNLLPAFSQKTTTSSNSVPSYLPPIYSYPPFLPAYMTSPEPSALPLPRLSFTISPTHCSETQQASPLNDSNSSTPNKTKVKRRLAAQFLTPLDLP